MGWLVLFNQAAAADNEAVITAVASVHSSGVEEQKSLMNTSWRPGRSVPVPHLPARPKGVIGLLISLLLLTALAAESSAQTRDPTQEPLKQMTLEELSNIEVTSVSKEPKGVRRVAAAVYVITQEDIRRSGATTLPEVLRLAPGVNVAQIDSDHWSVGVRGFGDQFSKSVLVLIDGRNVYTPLFAGISWAVQDTMLEDIERIEVIRGPGGTVWGANAVNGVINIITKSATNSQGTLVSVGAGNVDRTVAAARYGGGNDADFSYRVYGKGFNRGPEFHTDSNDFDKWRMGQGGFRADWSEGRDSFTLQGDFYKGTNGQSVAVGSYSPPAQIALYGSTDVSGANVGGRWRRDLGGGSDVQLQAYFDRTALIGPQIGETRNTLDVDFIDHVASLRRNDVITGLGLRVSPSDVTQTVPTLDVTPSHETNSLYSAFAQDEISLVEKRLWLTLGSKFEHNNYTGWEVQPSARLLWAPSDLQSVWVSVARAVRTPSRLEEDLQLTAFAGPLPNGVPAYVRVIGNTGFEAERLIGYEAGYRTTITPQFSVDISAFHNDHDGLEGFTAPVVSIETTPPPLRAILTVQYANNVTGHSDGIEIVPDWKPASWWQLKGSYSYLRITAESPLGDSDLLKAAANYEGSSPRHQVLVQPLLTLPNGWEIDQQYRYVSALPARQAPAYTTLDARIGWRATKQIELSVSGRNLFHPYEVEFAHDPGPAVAISRSVYATVTWRR